MKKNGFTLAEILITLGIVGVVAALTIPALISNTNDAQVGPKLAKAVSTFDQANEALLNDQSVSNIGELGFDAAQYAEALLDHIKATPFEYNDANPELGNTPGASANSDCYGTYQSFKNANTRIMAKDGLVYSISARTNVTDGTPHRTNIGHVFVDINGADGPNASGNDIFTFRIKNDGSLEPFGMDASDNKTYWKTACPNEETPSCSASCTASVFANNLKVMYIP